MYQSWESCGVIDLRMPKHSPNKLILDKIRQHILDTLKGMPLSTTEEVAREAGKSPSRTFNLLTDLSDRGLVERTTKHSAGHHTAYWRAV